MIRRQTTRALGALTVAAFILGVAPIPAGAEPALRPELGRPLEAAQTLLKQQKFREALAKIREAERVDGLSGEEKLVIDRFRGAAATGAGEYALAARSFEAAIASGRLPADDVRRLELAVGQLDFRAQAYAEAVPWLRKALADGAEEEPTRTLLVQALFQAKEYAAAEREAGPLLRAAERSGQPPAESLLQLVGAAQVRQGDLAGYRQSLARLVEAYPRPDYWRDLTELLERDPVFTDRLALDLARLARAAGTTPSPERVIEHAERALQAGLPGEAAAVIEEGYRAGVLGRGPGAERHARLRGLAQTQAAEDRRTLAKAETDPALAQGPRLVSAGLALVGLGEAGRGAALIERGIQTGGLPDPDLAALDLGYAWYVAGQPDKAAAAFQSVRRDAGPVLELAGLWRGILKQRS